MAWELKDGTPWVGATHELAGRTYSGATRTPASRPLVFVEQKKPKPSPSMQKPAKKKQTPRPKGATAWD
jgi:hypothetical protein